MSDHADFQRLQVVLEQGDFEATLKGLEDAVGLLGTGNLSLEQSVEAYELGIKLSRKCEELLDNAELRITELDSSK